MKRGLLLVLGMFAGWGSAQEIGPVPTRTESAKPLLFRVPPAFLVSLPWLESEDSPHDGRLSLEFPEPEPEGVQLLIGNDNPAFGFRRKNDPGGVGYTRLFSQVQLLQDERTALTLIIQAFTPSGLEADGLPESRGATVLTPALSFYRAITEDGVGLQFCLNRHVGLANPTRQRLDERWQCGLGVHCPLASNPSDFLRSWFVSLEAQAIDRSRGLPGTWASWDVLPGLHWIPAEKWQVSGGLTVPLDRGEASIRSWQIRASLQF